MNIVYIRTYIYVHIYIGTYLPRIVRRTPPRYFLGRFLGTFFLGEKNRDQAGPIVGHIFDARLFGSHSKKELGCVTSTERWNHPAELSGRADTKTLRAPASAPRQRRWTKQLRWDFWGGRRKACAALRWASPTKCHAARQKGWWYSKQGWRHKVGFGGEQSVIATSKGIRKSPKGSWDVKPADIRPWGYRCDSCHYRYRSSI